MEASVPKYVECRDGRVAFIGVTSSYHDTDAAGPQGGIIAGRPGINPLRRIEYYEVTEENYQALSKIAEETGMNDGYKWAIANGYRKASDGFYRVDGKVYYFYGEYMYVGKLKDEYRTNNYYPENEIMIH